MKNETSSSTNLLVTVLQELNSINQQLEGVIHPNILSKLASLKDKIQIELEPHFKEEEYSLNADALDEIAKINKLNHSEWSMSKIKASDMNKKTSTMKKIVYNSWGETQVHTFKRPQKITWLELWKIADELITKSGDSHHMFIESLYESEAEPQVLNLSTGS
jgi:hypothetical protein